MVTHRDLLLDLRLRIEVLLLLWGWRLWLGLDSILDVVVIANSMASDGTDAAVRKEGCEVDRRGHLQMGKLGWLLLLRLWWWWGLSDAVVLLQNDIAAVQVEDGWCLLLVGVVVLMMDGVERLVSRAGAACHGVCHVVAGVVEVEGAGHQLLQVEGVILVEADRSKVSSNVKE